jgi:hypothetical protein
MQNSGSITVRTGTTVPCPEMIVVWKRRRGGMLGVRARPAGTPQLDRAVADEFIARVNDRTRLHDLQKFYRRGLLYYDGLPWLGEAWLSETFRLGPPSRQYESALLGPRVILVDAKIEAIDAHDAAYVFDLLLRELSVFLSIVMRTRIRGPQPSRREWTFDLTVDGQVNCEHRQLGYHEPEQPLEMPARGTSPPIPLRPVSRPDFSLPAIYSEHAQQQLPEDIVGLWIAYTALPEDVRRRFLQAGNLYRQALSLGADDETLSLVLLVVGCEALKLPGPRYDGHNAAGVVKALLGDRAAEILRGRGVQALGVRNAHLHRGEFKGREFHKYLIEPSSHDPTFGERRRALGIITPAALIEWLRKGGTYAMPPRERLSDSRGCRPSPGRAEGPGQPRKEK